MWPLWDPLAPRAELSFFPHPLPASPATVPEQEGYRVPDTTLRSSNQRKPFQSTAPWDLEPPHFIRNVSSVQPSPSGPSFKATVRIRRALAGPGRESGSCVPHGLIKRTKTEPPSPELSQPEPKACCSTQYESSKISRISGSEVWLYSRPPCRRALESLHLSVVTVLLLLLGLMPGSSTACSLDSDAFKTLLSQRNDTQQLLKELKSTLIPPCLQDRNDFRCPWKNMTQEKQKEKATCCYTEMIRQVLHLFGTQKSGDAWAERALGQLLTSLWSGLEALEQRAEPSPSCPPPLAMDIRTYFSRISCYLKGKGYSPCSWEIVRAEMQVALWTFPVPAERSPKKRRRSMQESALPS